MFLSILRRNLLVVLVLIVGLIPLRTNSQPVVLAAQMPGALSRSASHDRSAHLVPSLATDRYQLYLPFVTKSAPPRSGIFGVEITPGKINKLLQPIQQAHISSVRYNGILWSTVEPTQGIRNWSTLASVDAELDMLVQQGTTPVVIVRSTPTWARKYGDGRGTACAPIRADALDAFASFMSDLVTRYRNVRYWELWNEPDVDPKLVDGSYPFGCWGDDADAYYGGGYYAEMLKRVYPAIKRANPAAQIVLGGLLLDCDPTYTYTPPRNCVSGKFLEGIIRNGGAPAFDLLSFHGYPIWSGNASEDWDLTYGTWRHRGGVVLGKLDFLRSVLHEYGIEKPVMLTEGGLICYRVDLSCPSDAMRMAQANYAVRLYTRALANNLAGVNWYTLNEIGYREGGMLDRLFRPRPVYTTFAFMSNLFQNASFSRALSTATYEGYELRKGKTTYQVYWTNDARSASLPLPNGTRVVYDKAGNTIVTTGGTATISFEPIIIEIMAE